MIRKSLIGDFWLIDGDTHVGAWCEANGRLDHDQNALPYVLPHVPAGGTVVDAGAYIGDWTIALLEKVGPAGKVYAFEPNPDAFECLKQNCPKAHCYQVALANSLGFGGLIPPSDSNHGTAMVFPEAPFGKVDLVKLDSMWLPMLDFLKADVEGGEYDLLLGGAETIKRCRPIMVIEVNESALAAHGKDPAYLLYLIRSFNYDVQNIYPRQEMGGPQWDALCLPL